jgi:hypothetical protein
MYSGAIDELPAAVRAKSQDWMGLKGNERS